MSTAYFLLNIAINHEMEVIRRIKEILESDNIFDYEIQGTFGIYDVVLKISANNDVDLRLGNLLMCLIEKTITAKKCSITNYLFGLIWIVSGTTFLLGF